MKAGGWARRTVHDKTRSDEVATEEAAFAKGRSRRGSWGSNHVHLNTRKLESLCAREGAAHTEYMDSDLRGFGVRVYANGRRVFIVRFSLKGRPQQRRDLKELTLLAARAKAAEILEDARQGRDFFISQTLLKKASIETVEGLCRRYLDDPTARKGNRPISAAYRTSMIRLIEREIIPVFGQRDPHSIQPDEVEAWGRSIASGEGRLNDRARGPAPRQANQCIEYLQAIYAWAARRRLIRYTPTPPGVIVKPCSPDPRTRLLTDAEVRRIFVALKEEPRQVAAGFLVLLLTGLRISAVLAMRWDWIDFDKGNLVIPPLIRGRKGKKLPLLVPIVRDLRRLLLEWLRPMAGESEYVFPGETAEERLLSVQRAKERLMEAAGVKDARIHDIRRLVQTYLSALEVEERVSDRILDHTLREVPASRAAYDLYSYRREKMAALTAWANKLRRIVGEDLLAVMTPERTGFQGKGPARRIGGGESYAARKARLQALGRDLLAERRVKRAALLVRRAAEAAAAAVPAPEPSVGAHWSSATTSTAQWRGALACASPPDQPLTLCRAEPIREHRGGDEKQREHDDDAGDHERLAKIHHARADPRR